MQWGNRYTIDGITFIPLIEDDGFVFSPIAAEQKIGLVMVIDARNPEYLVQTKAMGEAKAFVGRAYREWPTWSA